MSLLNASAPAHPPRATLADWSVMSLVVLVTFLSFLPALDNDFVDWDDQVVLLENQNYRGFDWARLRWMFTTSHMGHYQPLTWLTYALDYELWGMDPKGYHLTSILFHAATAGALYWAIRFLLFSVFCRGRPVEGIALSLAAGLGALLFASHPLRVESVAWATERRDVVSGLFLAIALATYLRAALHRGSDPNYRHWLLASVIAYALSLVGKPSGMPLPIVLVLLDVYPLRRLGGPPREWLSRDRRWLWMEKVPYLALAVAAGCLALMNQRSGGFVGSLGTIPLVPRMAIACYSTVSYLCRTFVPLRLSPLYAPDSPFDPWAPYLVASTIAMVVITVSVLLLRRRWPAGMVLWFGYLVMLAPVMGLIQIGPQIAADRYTYHTCLGWAVLPAAGWLILWQRRKRSEVATAGLVAGCVLAVAVLAVFVGLTWRQTLAWRDTGSLWQQAVLAHPDNGQAHSSLGAWYDRAGQLDLALHHHRLAIQYRPERAAGYARMGLTLVKQGRAEEAIAAYRKAIKINPRLAGAHTGLGMILTASGDAGKVREGLEHLEQAVRLKPAGVVPRINLANYFVRSSRFSKAADVLQEGVELRPRDPRLIGELAWMLATCPLPDVRDGRRAVELARGACQATGYRTPRTLDVLAAALAECGQFDQAVQMAKRAAALAGRQQQYQYQAGIARRVAVYKSHRPWRKTR